MGSDGMWIIFLYADVSVNRKQKLLIPSFIFNILWTLNVMLHNGISLTFGQIQCE